MSLDLVSAQEIGDRLGVKPRTVVTWKYRDLLPAPVAELKIGPVWIWADVEKWARETGRLR